MSQQLTTMDNRTALDLAVELSRAQMVPQHFKKSPGDCYIAVKMAERYGMDVFSLMSELYLIQGRAMLSGKLALAILNNSLAEPLRPTYAGEGDNRTITLTGRVEGEATMLSVTVTVRDAKTQNENWRKQPDQMLMYAAARMWGRRYAPDILLGIVFDDEEIRSPSLVPAAASARTAIASPVSHASADQAAPVLIDDETGEVIDTPRALPKNPTDDWRSWGQRLITAVRSAREIETVDSWLELNADMIFDMREEKPRLHETLMHNIEQHKLTLTPGNLP